jgi:hypothetical protein
MRFLIKEEVDLAFMLIDEAETGRIKKRALKDWVVSPLIFRICIYVYSINSLNVVMEFVDLLLGHSYVFILQRTTPYISCSISVGANE